MKIIAIDRKFGEEVSRKFLGVIFNFWVTFMTGCERRVIVTSNSTRFFDTVLISFHNLITLKNMSTIMDACKTVVRHYKEGNLNWPMIIYISLAHVAAVIGLFSILECKTYTLLWAFILWPISGIGITGGVHRLWAHRSYKATYPLRVYLMLANSIANQGSIWHWSRDHRVHHKHSEVRHFF